MSPWSRLQASMCAHCRHKGGNQSEMKALSVALVVMFKNNYNVVLLGINVAKLRYLNVCEETRQILCIIFTIINKYGWKLMIIERKDEFDYI